MRNCKHLFKVFTQIVFSSSRQGLPGSRVQGCKKQIITWFHVAKKTVANFDIAIHGFWIPAIPAGMTRCLDAYALLIMEINLCR